MLIGACYKASKIRIFVGCQEVDSIFLFLLFKERVSSQGLSYFVAQFDAYKYGKGTVAGLRFAYIA